MKTTSDTHNAHTTAHLPSHTTCELAKMRCFHTFVVCLAFQKLGAIFVATKIACAIDENEPTNEPNTQSTAIFHNFRKTKKKSQLANSSICSEQMFEYLFVLQENSFENKNYFECLSSRIHLYLSVVRWFIYLRGAAILLAVLINRALWHRRRSINGCRVISNDQRGSNFFSNRCRRVKSSKINRTNVHTHDGRHIESKGKLSIYTQLQLTTHCGTGGCCTRDLWDEKKYSSHSLRYYDSRRQKLSTPQQQQQSCV